MILVMVDLLEPDQGVVLSNLRQLDIEVGKNSLVEEFFPELGCKN